MKTKTAKSLSECDNDCPQAPNRSRQRRKRTFFTNEQLDRLEEIFQTEKFPGITTREELTEELGIKEDRIQVWFQNRRARWRKREIKNKPASSGNKPHHPFPACPESSYPTHPQIFTSVTSLLPYSSWTYQSTDEETPALALQFPNPLQALPFPLLVPSSSVNSESSPLYSPNPSPTESTESSESLKSCRFEPEVKDCYRFSRPSPARASCQVPPSYMGRRIHNSDEYDAAIGLLSVFGRQD